jgi:AraC-like DNA-binding protein
MKAQFEKVPFTDTTFLIKKEYLSYCEIPWHFHPEFELTLISKASGKKYIGNRIKDLDQDDLILLGPYLPHRWHYDKNKNENSKRESHQIVIQFSYDFLGEGFFEKSPFSSILQLLKRANNGISFHGEAKVLAKRTMNLMLQKKGFEQTLQLLTLLNTLSNSQHYEILSSIGFTENLNESDGNRMNQVYRFIISNFKDPITLSDVAKLSNMTPQAFCKYFKTRTKKNFSNFLNEVRISYACKILIEKNLDVLETCYASGFNNLSNFNRQFKRITKMNPTQYKSQFNC